VRIITFDSDTTERCLASEWLLFGRLQAKGNSVTPCGACYARSPEGKKAAEEKAAAAAAEAEKAERLRAAEARAEDAEMKVWVPCF